MSQLWSQDKVRKGEILIKKVDGADNIEDALTKHVCAVCMAEHMIGASLEFDQGRSRAVPKLENEWEKVEYQHEDEADVELEEEP